VPRPELRAEVWEGFEPCVALSVLKPGE
jgi:hypothetical protein